MNNTSKLSLTLCILVATLMLTLATLGIALVSSTQYVITDLNIHYGGGGAVTLALSDDCTNASDFDDYSNLEIGNTIESLPSPTILNKCFTGWYLDNSGNNKIDFPYEITAAVTLYPIYLDATSDIQYTYASNAYTVKAGTSAATGYVGTATNIVIPDIYDNGTNGIKPVTAIGAYAFRSKSAIVSVVIPEKVISIGDYAFYGCSKLTSITIPDSVVSMGTYVFYNCSRLTNVTVGSRVSSIGSYAFYGCSTLTSITIPDSVTSIGTYAFDYCSGLTSITIGSGVISIGAYAFYDCNGLTSIIVSSDNAKYRSGGNCLIENSSNKLILGCNNSVIPSGVVSIGDNAFSRCDGLTSITIPDSVTNIGDYAFQYCSGLTSITVSSGNTKYRSGGNCLIDKSSNALILGCRNSVIPSGVTKIRRYAFQSCSGLKSIIIPDSVISIEDSAFDYCSGLTSITIGSGVTTIGSYAFRKCRGLTSITIPDSVTSIEDSAFNYCIGLTSVTIGSGVKKIGRSAFGGCSNLTNVTFKTITGWTVTTSSTATTGDAVTISATDFTANATLLKTTHVSKYWNRA